MIKRYIVLRKIALLFICFPLALLSCNGAEATGREDGGKQWQFCGWYGGGCYPAIIPDPNIKDRLYLLSDVAGLWRSDDRGEKWYFINNGLINLRVVTLAIASSNSDIVYVGTKAGIMRSENAGKTWHYLSSTKDRIIFKRPDNYRAIAIDSQDYNKLYVGTKFGEVFYSDNGGETWQHLGRRWKFIDWLWKYIKWYQCPFKKRVPITALHLTQDNKNIFAASESGLIQYDFQENRWTNINKRKICDMVYSKPTETLYLAAGRQVIYSHDFGRTWQFTKAIPRGEVIRLSVQKGVSGGVELLAGWRDGWKGGVFLSLDNGRTWEDIERNLRHDEDHNPTRAWTKGLGRANSVAFDSFNPEVLYFTDWWGVWRSDDKGRSWNEKIIGAPNTAGSDIYITPHGDIYVATMDNGLLKSTDRGQTYKPIFPKKGYRKGVNGHVWRVIADPRNPKKIIATSSPWNGDINQVIISRNEGMKFIIARDGLPAKRPKRNTMWKRGYPRALALDPKRPYIIYLGIDGDDGGGLYISRDGGWHWKYSKGQPGSKRIYNALAVDPTNTDRLFWGAYGKRGGVYVSENGGVSWRYVFSQMTEIIDLAVNQQGWIYIAGNFDGPTIFFSNDHGKSWSVLKKFPGEGTTEALFINPHNSQQMGVSTFKWHGGSEGKIYWSENEGQDWVDITGDLPPGKGAAAMAYNPKDSYLYILRNHGSVYKTKL